MGVETIFHAECIHKKCAKSLKKYWQKCRASFVVVVAKIFYYFYLHLTWNVSCLVGILLILVSSWHLESSTFLKKTIIYRLNNLQSQRKNKFNSLVKKPSWFFCIAYQYNSKINYICAYIEVKIYTLSIFVKQKIIFKSLPPKTLQCTLVCTRHVFQNNKRGPNITIMAGTTIWLL